MKPEYIEDVIERTAHQAQRHQDLAERHKVILELQKDGVNLIDEFQQQFALYATHHRAKSTEESLAKAVVNEAHVGRAQMYLERVGRAFNINV
jgi:cell fate (sporulation/competence/biofilm development) regulator YmcA (YheA/YmcA/DUF963 family)